MEQELIERALEGELEAFNTLMELYIQSASYTAYLILHNKVAAEDAVQEALIQAYQSLKNFDSSKASFKTWFHRIVVHTTLKQRRKRWLTIPWADRYDVSIDIHPETEYIETEMYNAIYEAIRHLSIKHRTVIVLYYFQELSVSEIAQIVAISEGTVKSRLHQAREKLRKALTSYTSSADIKEGWIWNER